MVSMDLGNGGSHHWKSSCATVIHSIQDIFEMISHFKNEFTITHWCTKCIKNDFYCTKTDISYT